MVKREDEVHARLRSADPRIIKRGCRVLLPLSPGVIERVRRVGVRRIISKTRYSPARPLAGVVSAFKRKLDVSQCSWAVSVRLYDGNFVRCSSTSYQAEKNVSRVGAAQSNWTSETRKRRTHASCSGRGGEEDGSGSG